MNDSQPKPRCRRWRRWPFLFLLVFVGVPTAHYFCARWSFERELAEAIAETDRLDPRWRLDDIEADRKKYPDEQNSALQAIKASRLIGPTPATSLIVPGLQYHEVFGQLTSEIQLNAQQIELLQAAFEKIPEALVEARKLKDMPAGRFPVAYTPDWVDTVRDDQFDGQNVTLLLWHDVLLRAQHGDLDGALESCLAMLSAAASFGDEPAMETHAFRLNGHDCIVTGTERCLAQGFPSERLLKQLQDRLPRERAETRAHFVQVVRGERAGHHHVFMAVRDGKFHVGVYLDEFRERKRSFWDRVRDRFPMLLLKNYPSHLRYLNDLVAAAQLPLKDQPQRFRALEQVRRERAAVPELAFLPRVCEYAQWQAQDHSRLACVEAAVACERFRLAQGRWPKMLDELVTAEIIAAVPTDPFDGQPLRLMPDKDGLTIRGANDSRNDQFSPAVLSFRLWDPEHRRQPPRPAAELKR